LTSFLTSVTNALHAWEWIAILLARGSVGLLFLISGGGKIFVQSRREVMRKTIEEAGIPMPALNAVVVSIVEFLFGGLLVIGLLTPLCCLMLSGVMVMAIATTQLRNIRAESVIAWLGEFLYLPEVLYLVILVWLLFSGPGWLSLDQLLLSAEPA
jgi:putative oxidoreductase